MWEAIKLYWMHKFGELMTGLIVFGMILLVMLVGAIFISVSEWLKKRKKKRK